MSYAKLGNSCGYSLSLLPSAQKYTPLDFPLYNSTFTEMRRYPGISDSYGGPVISHLVKRPEDIKTGTQIEKKSTEDYNKSTFTCCGK